MSAPHAHIEDEVLQELTAVDNTSVTCKVDLKRLLEKFDKTGTQWVAEVIPFFFVDVGVVLVPTTPQALLRTISTALLANGAERKPGPPPRGALERAVERVLKKEQKQ